MGRPGRVPRLVSWSRDGKHAQLLSRHEPQPRRVPARGSGNMRGRRSSRAGAGAGAGGGAHGFVARGGALPRLELPIQRSHDDFRRRAIQLACAPHVHSDQAKSCGSRAGSTPAHGGLEAGGERRRGRTEGELDLAVQDVIGEIGQRRVPLEDLDPHPLQRTRAGLRRRAARAARWGRAWARARGGGGEGRAPGPWPRTSAGWNSGCSAGRSCGRRKGRRRGARPPCARAPASVDPCGCTARAPRTPTCTSPSSRAAAGPRRLRSQAAIGSAAPLSTSRTREGGGRAHQRRSRRARSPCRPTEPPPRPHRAAG